MEAQKHFFRRKHHPHLLDHLPQSSLPIPSLAFLHAEDDGLYDLHNRVLGISREKRSAAKRSGAHLHHASPTERGTNLS
jgi:hypothetical protein